MKSGIDKNKIEFFFFLLFSKLFKLLGLKGTRKFARLLGAVVYYFLPVRKNVVIKNLSMAFPDLPEKDIKEIGFKNYKSIAVTFAELLYLPYLNETEISSIVSCPQISIIRDAFESGKGVFLLTAHIGNWELAGVSVSKLLNIPLNVLAKPQRNPYVTTWVNNARAHFGNKVISLGLSVREIFQCIKDGEIIAVVGDQRGPRDGVRIKFFNVDTATYPGTASMALKTECKVIFSFSVRQQSGNYEIYLTSLDLDEIRQKYDDPVKGINQEYMNALEEIIRKFPEQWFWMHNIWKY